MSELNNYTYQIKYYEDNLLSTGGSNLENSIQDYITVINQNGEEKININGFIKKQNINKSLESNGLTIVINYGKIYKDYEIYNVTIKNNNSNSITISDGNNDKDICLLDKNDTKYPCFLNEFAKYMLSIKAGQEWNSDIRFNKIYDTDRIIDKVQFNNIKVGDNETILINIDL